MNGDLTALEMALRLACAFGAGALLGYNRGEHGHAAGLRTTILVSLSAAAAMVMAFALLPLQAHGVGAFARMDVMRLPLGILSGIGFIGGGAILRRGDIVRGVTTAATIWIATVIGLVFGAGLYGLGAGLSAVAFFVIWAIKLVEPRMLREHRAHLFFSLTADAPSEEALRQRLAADRFKVVSWAVTYRDQAKERDVSCDLEWMSRTDHSHPPRFVGEIAAQPGVLRASWHPRGSGEAGR